MFHASRPSRGAVSCVALGLPGHPPKGVVPRYPPRGVLRDCSRPVPGSCRGVVSPLSGGFPHKLVCGFGGERSCASAPSSMLSSHERFLMLRQSVLMWAIWAISLVWCGAAWPTHVFCLRMHCKCIVSGYGRTFFCQRCRSRCGRCYFRSFAGQVGRPTRVRYLVERRLSCLGRLPSRSYRRASATRRHPLLGCSA